MKTITPKFKIDDKVNFKKPDLYGMINGVVTEVQKLYWEIDPQTNKFKTGGLAIMENTIPSTALPYTFENDVLRITFPESTLKLSSGVLTEYEKTTEYRLHSYVYTVKNEKMSTVYNERSLMF